MTRSDQQKRLRLAKAAAKDYLRRHQDISRLLSETHTKVRREAPRIKRMLKELRLMTAMLESWKKGEYPGLSWRVVLSVLTVLIYFLNPVDACPDAIPVLGFLDDLSLFTAMLPLFQQRLDEFENWRKKKRLAALKKKPLAHPDRALGETKMERAPKAQVVA